MSLRYLHLNGIREDFITFVNAYDSIREECVGSEKERRLTEVTLCHIVEDSVNNFNLDLNFCVGFGVDSCSVMASETKSDVNEFKKSAKHAMRCPCSNHILNNSLASSSKVISCRNASGTMRKVVAFANISQMTCCF
ncbi:unnamed protein product [Diabrotica balteata]|uniref:Uncharacterized protein n=1 Tax=Diabrotica balteata TaxID=107213 RepID=A0A9N9XH41_DIABA|nr:unnamed protein product [Diabrotica balteata]